MSEFDYSKIPEPMKFLAVTRLLELKAKKQGVKYNGSSFKEIEDATKKLEKDITRSKLLKRHKTNDEWGMLDYHSRTEGRTVLISVNNDYGNKHIVDDILKMAGLIEINPVEYTLKVEL